MNVDVYTIFNEVKKEIYALYDEYSRIYSSSINIPHHGKTSSQVEETSKINRGEQLLLQKAKKSRGSSSSSNSELDSYITSLEFGEDFQNMKFPVLQW